MNVVTLGNVGAGKSATLNSLIGHPVLPTGENGATRAPICIDLQRDSSLSSKVLVLQIDSRSQQVSASALRHSLQDRLSKGAAAQSSGKGRPEEIYMKLCTSAAMGVDETPSISMKKKHSLDALEQRFAKTNSPNQVQVGNQNLLALASGSPFSSVPVTGLVLHACSNKQISKDVEDDSVYLKLSKPVHENLLKSDGEKGAIKSRKRLSQKQTKRSKHHMSLKQHRQCGSFEVPREFHNFDFCKPMNHKWEEYIQELLHEKRKNGIAQCLLTADLHGAILLVAESKIAGFTGEWGIMIRETAQTFGMVTVNNVFRVVPKKGSTFILRAGKWKITLIGDKLLSKNRIEI